MDKEEDCEEDEDNFSKYLLDRVKQLEDRCKELKDTKQDIENKMRDEEDKKIKFKREARKLKSEVDRLKKPPLVVGTVLDVLDDDRLVIKSTTGPKFIVKTPDSFEDKDIKSGTRVALNQQSLGVVEAIPSPKDPSVYGMEVINSPTTDYTDIGGLNKQITELKETVELPLTKPDKFKEIGIEPPKGILLYGPPGTGKTLMAKAVANKTEASFIKVVGSELVQKYIGEGARLVREVFKLAEEKSPSIIFIDELDAIGARRQKSSTSGDREVQRTLMQLLSEMDGFDARGEVKLIGATNRPDILDKALLRPGRFDRIIKVPMPDKDARQQIFDIHTRNMNLEDDISLEKISSMTEEHSGADIKAITTEAGMLAIRNDRNKVKMEDFLKAVEKVKESNPAEQFGEASSEGLMFA
ncbi:MAG: ATP-dependent 26S proteasome regulatory subunit [Candidatus Methanohalarchaeum thermophilum]|uniref:Proteasome-activating nucleotidase n=1 Tax=Methanohalarchaeum thermophilum TaxID=1903181 RepID=A0A1Q6DTM5_METT1|nr:MAG: ATP-dependent 26S proteasome regulatory subunit [Candidatus Methanohalarchaeum thermophilum]